MTILTAWDHIDHHDFGHFDHVDLNGSPSNIPKWHWSASCVARVCSTLALRCWLEIGPWVDYRATGCESSPATTLPMTHSLKLDLALVHIPVHRSKSRALRIFMGLLKHCTVEVS